MLNIDWEENRIKVLIFIAISLGIIFYFSSSNDDFEVQDIKVVQPKIEKEITAEPNKENIIIKEKIKLKIQKIEDVKDDIMKNENISQPQEIKEELIELYRSSDNSGRYTIKLLSNKTVENKKRNFTRYIIISGEIENDSQISEFPMSLNENYTEFTEDIFITINDITRDDNKTLKCDGYFLNSLNIDTMYQIKIDIIEDSTNCYIKSQQALPPFIKELGNNIKPVIVEVEERN